MRAVRHLSRPLLRAISCPPLSRLLSTTAPPPSRVPPPPCTSTWAPVDEPTRAAAHAASISDPSSFWGARARSLVWSRPFTSVLEHSFSAQAPYVRWFGGGELNASVNCLDRHVSAGRGDAPALTWVGDDDEVRSYTYASLLEAVEGVAGALQAAGVRRGDVVTLLLPQVPAAAIAMLACARLGAPHSAVFAGLSAAAVADRLVDAGSSVVITADVSLRGGRRVGVKATLDEALSLAEARGLKVRRVLVCRRGGRVEAGAAEAVPWQQGRDEDMVEAVAAARRAASDAGTALAAPAAMRSSDPLFLLYTSGSTGKPKGVVHSTGGYLVYAGASYAAVFAPRAGDTHFCTADIGWITGHTYGVYAPLLAGAHTLLFEGIPTFPDASRLWAIVERHRCTSLYTAPTAVRALMVHGEAPVAKHDLRSLRVLGVAGEPIGPTPWHWLFRVVGGGRASVVDTWWQTETGGIMLACLPGTTDAKPGVAGKGLYGVAPRVVRADGSTAAAGEQGHLVIDAPWPGMMTGLWRDPARFAQAYFSDHPGAFTTGDGAVVDGEGDIQILGRVDDVLNVSGHRLGCAEMEGALGSHEAVAESAVVGMPHDIKGEGIYAFVVLKAGATWSPALRAALVACVRRAVGPIAHPDIIHVAKDLPKTRSGKIMRRLLRKVAAGDSSSLGDTSTLMDPTVVHALLESRREYAGAHKG